MDIYDKLGVRKVVNAQGTVTRLGGSLMSPEAYAAMAEAGRSFVFLEELHEKAGAHIARLVGVEAAQVCSGAAGGMVLAAAACLAGSEREKIWALPDTEGWKNEIIVQKSGPGDYVNQGMRSAGARVVEVGTVQRMEVADIAAALSEKTTAIQLYLGDQGQPSIAAVAPLARQAGVSIIVDAAAELPPRKNFTEPLAQGADLVIFSGGKGLFGPQGTGLILGATPLVEACRLNCNPHSAIGRSMKVGKEDICALIAALERFLSQDEEAEMQEYKRRADYIVEQIGDIPGIQAQALMADPRARPVIPRVYIDLQPGCALSGAQICNRMLDGQPPIVLGGDGTTLRVDVMMLEEWELQAVGRRLQEVLAGGS
jgi:uncharacterized pyridoxal phosphate-dependent enzyme